MERIKHVLIGLGSLVVAGASSSYLAKGATDNIETGTQRSPILVVILSLLMVIALGYGFYNFFRAIFPKKPKTTLAPEQMAQK